MQEPNIKFKGVTWSWVNEDHDFSLWFCRYQLQKPQRGSDCSSHWGMRSRAASEKYLVWCSTQRSSFNWNIYTKIDKLHEPDFSWICCLQGKSLVISSPAIMSLIANWKRCGLPSEMIFILQFGLTWSSLTCLTRLPSSRCINTCQLKK